MSLYVAELERFTYKPGVTLRCDPINDEHCQLTVETFGPNSRGGVDRVFSASRAIATGLTPEQFRDELVGLIRWWEEHEAYEWMRWDGQLVREPHGDSGQATGQEDGYRP